MVNQQRGHQKGHVPRAGCANYTTVEEILTGEEVLAGTFSLNEHPVIILFDSVASHDFISSTCAKKAMLSMVATEAPYVISTPRGRVSHPVLRPKSDAHRMYAQDQVVIHTARM
jgi:hypothetical protein